MELLWRRTARRRPLWRKGLFLRASLKEERGGIRKERRRGKTKRELTAQRRHNLVHLTPVSAPLKRRGRYRSVSVDPRPNVLRSERQWALVCLSDRGPNPSSDRSSLGNAGTGGRNIRPMECPRLAGSPGSPDGLESATNKTRGTRISRNGDMRHEFCRRESCKVPKTYSRAEL